MITNNEIENKIQICKQCSSDSIICDLVTYKKPSSFYGSIAPKVMIIGHSPSVRTSEEAEVVLKMNMEKRPIYNYIYTRILIPLGIPIENLYCTNLIKCKTTKLPEDYSRKLNFFEKAFNNCKNLLEQEISELKPTLVISLSERVLKTISLHYIGKQLKMKESFGKLYSIRVSGLNIPYIPLVHLPKGSNSLVEKHYFPEQTFRLNIIAKELGFTYQSFC